LAFAGYWKNKINCILNNSVLAAGQQVSYYRFTNPSNGFEMFRKYWGKTRRNRNKNKIFREEVGIKKCLNRLRESIITVRRKNGQNKDINRVSELIFNPLKTEFLHSFIYKSSSYLTGNTIRLHYKAQPVNAV
jgi:hypothetical protein